MVAVRHTQWHRSFNSTHHSGILECGSAKPGMLKNLIIPRLGKSETAYLSLGSKSVDLERYTGPKKVNPPDVVCRSGPSFTDVCALHARVERAQLIDTHWLNSLLHDWTGLMLLWREQNHPPKPPQSIHLAL